jgi:hypothetical protein
MAFSILVGCTDKFLNVTPLAKLTPEILNDSKGIESLLIAAYSCLDGTSGGAASTGWECDFSNWVYGGVASDDFLKGSEVADQSLMDDFSRMSTLNSTNPYLRSAWAAVYEGVSRCNIVLKTLSAAENISDNEIKRISAEARYLRAHYYHLGRRYWGKIPWIDENVVDFRVSNDADIFDNIKDDYIYAIANLPIEPKYAGSAHVNAAKAGLAKLYMDEHRYGEAKVLLDDIINCGRYILLPNYFDNFNPNLQNLTTNTEAIFQIQAILGPGIHFFNGNWGRAINGIAQLHGCCGFLQPTQNLVNAFKTDVNGLPYLDTFNDTALKNDDGIKSSEPFTPTMENVDPRLDWTVSRRGIPFFDFDIDGKGSNLFPGQNFIVDPVNYGPYRAKKFLPTKAQMKAMDGGFLAGSRINYSIYRFADILLLRAECAVEENNLDLAVNLVNRVRLRAQKGEPVRFLDGKPAANYVIEPYPSFPNKEFAWKAVLFERRLELADEGHRRYDLIRFGVGAKVMNAYFASEGSKRAILNGAAYKSDFLPIPDDQIKLTLDVEGNPTLTQVQGY